MEGEKGWNGDAGSGEKKEVRNGLHLHLNLNLRVIGENLRRLISFCFLSWEEISSNLKGVFAGISLTRRSPSLDIIHSTL